MGLNILKKVSSQWRTIGIRTGQADDLDNFERQAMFDNNISCQRVFKAWIDNGGHRNYPLTWQGLYDLLCDIDHRGIANAMADAKNAQGASVRKR